MVLVAIISLYPKDRRKGLILDITFQGCPCWCLHLSCLNSCLSYNPRVSSWYESWGAAWPVYGPEGAFITASATIHILHLEVLHLHLWSLGTKAVSSFVPCTSDKFASALEASLLLFKWTRVVSESLWLHGLQPARLPCPPLSAVVCSNSCPLNWWCCLTTSSSATTLLLLASVFPRIKVFSNESALHIRWSMYWSFSVSSSSEYSGWISFRIDWFDLLAVQGTLKSLLQHCNLKASAFFMARLSHLYMTTGGIKRKESL